MPLTVQGRQPPRRLLGCRPRCGRCSPPCPLARFAYLAWTRVASRGTSSAAPGRVPGWRAGETGCVAPAASPVPTAAPALSGPVRRRLASLPAPVGILLTGARLDPRGPRSIRCPSSGKPG